MKNIISKTNPWEELKDKKKFEREMRKKTLFIKSVNFNQALEDIKKKYPENYTRRVNEDNWKVLCVQDEDYKGKIQLMSYTEIGGQTKIICENQNVYEILSNYEERLPDYL